MKVFVLLSFLFFLCQAQLPYTTNCNNVSNEADCVSQCDCVYCEEPFDEGEHCVDNTIYSDHQLNKHNCSESSTCDIGTGSRIVLWILFSIIAIFLLLYVFMYLAKTCSGSPNFISSWRYTELR